MKDSIPTEDGIRLTVDGSAMVKSINNSKDFIDVSADAYYARCRPLRPHRHLHPRTDCPIAEDHYAAAADVQKNYTASENIDALIDKAREEMERAAKSLDFLAAAKFRDRMYELQKLREENRNQNSQFTIHNS